MTGEDWVIEAKAARRQGRLSDAVTLYNHAVEQYREQGNEELWAHSLRHAAELALEVKNSAAAQRAIEGGQPLSTVCAGTPGNGERVTGPGAGE